MLAVRVDVSEPEPEDEIKPVPLGVSVEDPVFVAEAVGVTVRELVVVPDGVALILSGADGVSEGLAPDDKELVGEKDSLGDPVDVGDVVSVVDDVPEFVSEPVGVRDPVPVPDGVVDEETVVVRLVEGVPLGDTLGLAPDVSESVGDADRVGVMVKVESAVSEPVEDAVDVSV